MRTFPALIALILATLSNLSAGQLDLAVIQFPELKTVDELNAAFASEELFEVTNSDRTMTRESYLKGGTVLFVQRLAVAPGSSFAVTTRLRFQRADVEGLLGGGMLSVTINISEGVKAGIRSFQNKVYRGSAPVPAGPPRVISIREIHGKAPSSVKGETKIVSYQYATAVVAQYRP